MSASRETDVAKKGAGWRLVADIGGTNARFARACGEGGEICDLRALRVRDFTEFDEALESVLAGYDGSEGCMSAAVAAAGPVAGNCVTLTNAPWTISGQQISERLGGVPVRVVNDLAAVALSLSYLTSGDTVAVTGAFSGDGEAPGAMPGVAIGGAGQDGAHGAMLAVNVGTGFGAAAVAPHGGGWAVLPGEAGHMGLPDLARIWGLEISRRLDPELFGSVEDVLSGRGVVAVYAALGGHVPNTLTAGDVFHAASAVPRDEAAVAAVRAVGRLLGCVAGDLMLATGAWAGVYLTGSVVDGWAACGNIRDFAEQFNAKGAMTEKMRGVQVRRITRAEPALLGLALADLDTL